MTFLIFLFYTSILDGPYYNYIQKFPNGKKNINMFVEVHNLLYEKVESHEKVREQEFSEWSLRKKTVF